MRLWPFIGGVVLSYLASFGLSFITVGLVWDPNQARLLASPPEQIWNVAVQAFTNAVPLAATTFLNAHAVVATMGLGFVLLLLIGLVGAGEQAGRRTVYGIAAILAALGVVRFFLG